MTRKKTRKPKRQPQPSRHHHYSLAILGLALCLLLGIGLLRFWGSLQRPENVVLISVDTLHSGHLGAYGYEGIRTPHIDNLAREGILFENAISMVPLTLPSHASIFTGRTPLQHGVVDNFTSYLGEEEETLAEILEANGYVTAAFVGSFVLDSSWGIAQGFDTYYDEFEAVGPLETSAGANERRGDEVLAKALPWIRRERQEPFFVFIHLFDPHTPYDPPEPFGRGCEPGSIECYDGEVAFVDSLVGQVLSELETLALSKETLVVLVGDHGESLGDHGESTHGFFLYDETVKVPLIFKGPGVPGSVRVPTLVRTVDIVPTILDFLGVPVDGTLDGVSLRPVLLQPQTDLGLDAYLESRYSRIHFGWAPLSGLRTQRYKFVDAPRRELYDLESDPEESRNIAHNEPDVVQELATRLDNLRDEAAVKDPTRHTPDFETVERLRALGYVTSSLAASEPIDADDLADPKDKIDLVNRITEAREARQKGDIDGARVLLRAVLEEDPEVTLAHLMLGNIYLEGADYDGAAGQFGDVLARESRNLEALYGMALADKGLGRYESAAAKLVQCLELDPNQFRAVYKLAEVRLAMGQGRQAEELLSSLGPDRRDVSVNLLLASSLLAQGKRQGALEILNAIEQQHQTGESVLLSLGNLFLEADMEQRAVAAYQRAVEAPSSRSGSVEDAEVLNAVGHLLAQYGEISTAALAFEKAVGKDPAFVPAYNNLGIAMAQLGRYDAAEEAFRLAIGKAPRNAEAYNNLGFLYLQSGKADQAIPLFRRALSLQPDYAEARANLQAALSHAQ